MIFDGRLAAARDEEDLLDAVRDQFLHHVLHDGLTCHRQHFFGLRLGGRQKPRSVSGNRYYCALDHPMNIPARAMLYWAKKKRTGMEDIQQQLAALRKHMARINRKYADLRAGDQGPGAAEHERQPEEPESSPGQLEYVDHSDPPLPQDDRRPSRYFIENLM